MGGARVYRRYSNSYIINTIKQNKCVIFYTPLEVKKAPSQARPSFHCSRPGLYSNNLIQAQCVVYYRPFSWPKPGLHCGLFTNLVIQNILYGPIGQSIKQVEKSIIRPYISNRPPFMQALKQAMLINLPRKGH